MSESRQMKTVVFNILKRIIIRNSCVNGFGTKRNGRQPSRQRREGSIEQANGSQDSIPLRSLPQDESALGSGEDSGRANSPKCAVRCGRNPVQAIIGVPFVGALHRVPLRAIPIFSQGELGAALDGDNILASSPDVVTR